ncbi:MAG: sugar transferase [Alphaproteobacteria bacterium]|nr:MAG: sugar transferase [Alphaproteobacteria bacterium]
MSTRADRLPLHARTARPRRAALRRYQDGPKRRLDIAGVLLMAPLALPLIAVLWLLVRLDGGPGFFGHWRVGRDGRAFRCWKLRSMVPDAEARLEALLASDPLLRAEWRAGFKLTRDPRVTRLGRFLRKTSLDELPQLWNVLRGEMSLVGPRPVPRAELAAYGGYAWAYLECRPGLTGLWQVSGRNDTSYEERIRLDVSYLARAGLGTDLAILARTPLAVIGCTGR